MLGFLGFPCLCISLNTARAGHYSMSSIVELENNAEVYGQILGTMVLPDARGYVRDEDKELPAESIKKMSARYYALEDFKSSGRVRKVISRQLFSRSYSISYFLENCKNVLIFSKVPKKNVVNSSIFGYFYVVLYIF